MFNLKNKRAVVTGAGSGIGKAIALALAEQGAVVFILEYNEEAGKSVVNNIVHKGGVAHHISCNVAVLSEVENGIQAALGDNNLDILVNNAGIAHVGNVETTSEEDFDRLLQVNVKGVFNCLKAGIPKMKQSGGSIVNVSSIAAHVGISDRFAYSMTKGAVHAMTLSVAKDYISNNIRCNSIAPARVHTPFVDGFISKNYPGKEVEMFEKLSKTQPIGRMGTPDEIAAMVVYLCSDEASFITGSCMPIDGGFMTLNN